MGPLQHGGTTALSRIIKKMPAVALLLLVLCFSVSTSPTRTRPAVAQTDATLDAEVRALIVAHALTGDPTIGRTLPTIDSPLAQLGRHLFFTKALSGELDTACVSCHLPTLGGGDGLSLSVGVHAVEPDLIGPGRIHYDNTPLVPRNAPTTFNLALWDQVLFYDGRVESLDKIPGTNGAGSHGIRTPDTPLSVADPLAGDNLSMAQARFPVTSEAEMRGVNFAPGAAGTVVRNHLAERLCAIGTDALDAATSAWWQAEFTQVFGPAATVKELITEQRIAQALAAYEQSQIFVTTPWQAYVQGDDQAIGTAAKRGALLFFRSVAQGGANCAMCHSGDFFTDEQFHLLAIPQIGPGKGDGAMGTDDYGRYRESGKVADLYAFRTPTLLNVTETGPYGHDGAYITLAGIVRHHLNPQAAVANYDWWQLDPTLPIRDTMLHTRKALIQLQLNWLLGVPSIEIVTLTDAQVADLLKFLETLTDPCVQDPACLAPWLLAADSPDPYAVRPLLFGQ
jgi:cytochrome c peroxidase